jgi:hypothetical protein
MPISTDVVEAKGGTFDWDFLARPGTNPTWTPEHGYLTETWGSDPRFKVGGSFHGWFHGVVGSAGYAWNDGAKAGPDPNDYSSFAGVLGTGVYVTGVAGTSINGVGVYGQSGENPEGLLPPNGGDGRSVPLAGVVGGSNSETGVLGSSRDAIGVDGRSFSGVGVHGFCHTGLHSGVVGRCVMQPTQGPKPLAPLPTAGVTGTYGGVGPSTLPGFSTTPGVFGTSTQRAGVVGTSDALMGVYGYSTGNAGVVGQSANPNSYGGFFFGNVMVTGNLTVNGTISSPNKQAVVAFPDGTQRVLYCMESPEYWFEVFGAAKLKRGRAAVKLDADFGRLIRRGDYRVFVTPEGDCRGLYVRRKTAASFEVRELAGGKSNVAFSYRVVGRRNDIKAPRFAKTNTNTRLSLPAAATRAKRKATPSAAELRAFAAGLEQEARGRRVKGARKDRRFRAPPKGMRRPSIRPQLQLPQAEKK